MREQQSRCSPFLKKTQHFKEHISLLLNLTAPRVRRSQASNNRFSASISLGSLNPLMILSSVHDEIFKVFIILC